MHWNHRVLRHEEEDGSQWFAIHEVHYDDDGEPNGCTASPIKIVQENLVDMQWEIDKIQECLQRPVIDYSYFEKQEKEAEADEKENKDSIQED